MDKPPTHLLIAPLLLIPFVENAFTHVSDFETRENSVRLELHFDGNRLLLTCSNTKKDRPVGENQNDRQGIGLTNVKKRLHLIYVQNYRLRIDTANEWYTVHIEILLEDAELFNNR